MNASDDSNRLDAPLSVRTLLLVWGLPLFVGLALRLQNIAAQVLGGDELHSVRLALSAPVRRILVRHTEFDHGRPMTALFRVLMDAGVVMTELTFRAPSLLAGGLILVVVPRLFRGHVSRGAGVALVWLLAVSPVLVVYSRMVRTYMPVLLFALLAVFAFRAWWEAIFEGRPGRGRRWAYAAIYVVAATLAVWLHLLVAPFVLAPFLYALVDGLVRWRRRTATGASLLALVGLGVVTALFVSLPQWVMVDSLARLAETRGGRARFGPRTLLGTLTLQSGTRVGVLSWSFWAVALVGAWIELRQRPRFFVFAVSVCLLHVVTILLVAPKQSNQPLVFNRYVLVVLPFVFAWVGSAMSELWRARTEGGGLAMRAICVLALVGLFLGGPLSGRLFWTSPFTQHNRFVDFSIAKSAPEGVHVSDFYSRLGDDFERGPVLEFPWNWQWNQSLAPFYTQMVHGCDVLVAGRMLPLASDETAMRNVASIARQDGTNVAPESFLSSRARYAVIHLDMAVEELRFQGGGGKPGPGSELIREDGQKMAALLRRRFGPPLFEDADVVVWDLDVVRRAPGRRGR